MTEANENNKVPQKYLEVLQEIGTMGAGRAATALAEMTSTTVEIAVPKAELVPAGDFDKLIGDSGKAYFVLIISLEGELGGRVFFLITPEEAKQLGSILMGIAPDDVKFEDSLFQSSLKEVLNIIVGAYMAALSELTGYGIMFSVPYLALDILTAVFIANQTPQKSDELILIKTSLKIKDKNLDGMFLFFPDMPTIQKIFKAIGLEEKQ